MFKFLKNRVFLHLLIGFLFASSFYLYIEYRYEEKTLNAFIGSVFKDDKLDKSNNNAVILAAMQKTHLQFQQKDISSMGMELSGVEALFTSPLMQFALTKDGACGGNSLVLAQLLQGMGFDVRVGQMLVNGKYGGHIILEAKSNDHWVVLDPLYNLAFKNTDGSLASFAQVSSNWNFYTNQLPNNYNKQFKYESINYTNWSKIPYLGNVIKTTMSFFCGKTVVENMCIRKHFLQPKKLLFIGSIYLLVISLIAICNKRYFNLSVPFNKIFNKLKRHNTATA